MESLIILLVLGVLLAMGVFLLGVMLGVGRVLWAWFWLILIPVVGFLLGSWLGLIAGLLADVVILIVTSKGEGNP